MRFSYFDSKEITPQKVTARSSKIGEYEKQVDNIVATKNDKKPEYSLVHVSNPHTVATALAAKKEFKGIKHLILIGIGGSSLGVEAVHQALGEKGVSLTVLDTVAPVEMQEVLALLKKVKNQKQIAVCVVSKSGNTTETLANANIVLAQLEKQFGKKVYSQVVCIGDPKSSLVQFGKRQKAHVYTMPAIVGGRFSVGTEASLIPLAMLQHDVEALIEGMTVANTPEFTNIAKESAARIAAYVDEGYRQYVFFAFEKRLERLGAWYRQLYAESLGKEKDKKGKKVSKGMLPTIVTPVELHSVGQLLMSGFPGIYTDFVTFDDGEDVALTKKGVGKEFAKHSLAEVTAALYGGVVSAYHSKELPHRSTIFDDELPYSLGLFLGMRMREIMYVAQLQQLNAFDQPNVELYKKNTKKILNI